jgi:hypothetical protein
MKRVPACAVDSRWLRHDSEDVAVSAMKACGGLEVYLHVFLSLVVEGVEWSASHLDRFTWSKKNTLDIC